MDCKTFAALGLCSKSTHNCELNVDYNDAFFEGELTNVRLVEILGLASNEGLVVTIQVNWVVLYFYISFNVALKFETLFNNLV
jgi:hypothetical protein